MVLRCDTAAAWPLPGFCGVRPAVSCFRVEAVFEDLPVEGPAADIEYPRGFLLVPANRFQHADDVRPFGVCERRKARAGIGGGRAVRVQELEIGIPDDATGRGQRRPRDGALEL